VNLYQITSAELPFNATEDNNTVNGNAQPNDDDEHKYLKILEFER
jgi:hypothetical protein